MASDPLIDISGIDLQCLEFDMDHVRTFNPHRHEFEQLHGIVKFWDDPLSALAIRHVRDDEFWCRGHMPGDPIFPGVLMVEACAQAASFCFHQKYGRFENGFFGFGGIEGVRFRGAVRPGDDLVIMTRVDAIRRRYARFDVQGWVDGRLMMEGQIIGVVVPANKGTTAATESTG